MQATLRSLPLAHLSGRRLLSFALYAVGAGILLAGAWYQNFGMLCGGVVALLALWRSGSVAAPERSSAPKSTGDGHSSTAPRERATDESPTPVARHSATDEQQSVSRAASPEEQIASAATATEAIPPEHCDKRLKQQSGMGNLVRTMIRQRRYALLLRNETVSQLDEDDIADLLDVVDDQMSVVPAGRVLVGEYAERATWSSTPSAKANAGLVEVDGCYLDRYAVTNEDFQHFVDAGGYEEFQLWPEEALPALFEFVDRTGTPAPAFWQDGRFAPGDEQLPVVGISWYEAAAYAQWVGKRLPTDAEWTKAGAWPVETSPGRVSQRRYPWGDTFESSRAALWSAGVRGPQPVDQLHEGASLGGVQQLIGNVWEWSVSELDATSRESAGEGDGLKIIHGGAYNTYFENQATCHFRSGEQPLGRRANIGFRLALSFDTIAEIEAE